MRRRSCWSSTKPIACWTWASGPTSGASSARCPSDPPDAAVLGDDARTRSCGLALEMHARRRTTCRWAQRSVPARASPTRIEAVGRHDKVDWLSRSTCAGRRRPGAHLHPHQDRRRRLARKLPAKGVRAAALHADRSQDRAAIAVEGFRAASTRCWSPPISPPAASTSTPSHTVINYEVPDSSESYVHRVGRTGRAGCESGRRSRWSRRKNAATGGPMEGALGITTRLRTTPLGADADAGAAALRSCRWQRPAEGEPDCCGHRDVLPMAGTTGFNPEAWCPDCATTRPSGRPSARPAPEPSRWAGAALSATPVATRRTRGPGRPTRRRARGTGRRASAAALRSTGPSSPA